MEQMIRDKAGIFFSGLCLCHCLLTPAVLFLIGTGTLTSAFASEITHQILLMPVLFLALYSLPVAWYKNRDNKLLILALSGLTWLIAARFFHGYVEIMLTTLGSVCLISGHIISLNQCKH
ncbi:MerC domain-containing protein [Lacimicrobium alkaliphilum]|uniref:MerC mercury resistance protein n=1 Tax=Lacimicrobium alkaliphilum TaxID=1526571 RepID=A0ABQ1RQ50_9ALTE|nr:MerC domain-containing protein [Lacimicrobium alkaliphilum]GGD76592.1 hypothetical protein GCM10011357_34510 [Lacimicrobium alkaliphilum]